MKKMDILYQYLTGVPFRQRIEAIVEAFSMLGKDIAKERKSILQKSGRRKKCKSRKS